jgi:magnesium transporter
MISPDLQEIEEQLLAYVEHNDLGRLTELLSHHHASDLARILEDLNTEDRVALITRMPPELAADVLSEMDPETHPEELLEWLSIEQSKAIFNELDSDDATDLIAALPEEEQAEYLERVDKEDAADIRQLMAYPEDSAGRLMSMEIMSIPENFSRKQAMEEIVRKSEEVDDFYYLYIIDKANKLTGIVSFKNLLRAKPFQEMKEIAERKMVYVKASTDQEEVAKIFSRYNLPSLPVVGENMELLGRITFDDVLDVIEKESTEDLLSFAGVSEDAELRGGWYESVKTRIPWLLANLFTASLAGLITLAFHGTLEKLVIIASYLPIIAGVAGNGGTQTLAITLRRISTEDISREKIIGIITKELLVGLTNGVLIGLSVSLMAYAYEGDIKLGLVVFFAMAANLLISGMAGSVIPLVLKQINIDPAVASSIFITAMTDILGYTLLLGLASAVLL